MFHVARSLQSTVAIAIYEPSTVSALCRGKITGNRRECHRKDLKYIRLASLCAGKRQQILPHDIKLYGLYVGTESTMLSVLSQE